MNKIKLIHDLNWKSYNSDYYTFEIHLTMNCNLKCAYCYNGFEGGGTRSNNIIFQDLKRILDVILENTEKKIEIIFTGGEPAIYHNFFDLLDSVYRYLDQQNRLYKIIIMTNGFIFLNKKKRNLISNYQKLQINHSLHLDFFQPNLIESINSFKNFVKIKIMYQPKYHEYLENEILPKIDMHSKRRLVFLKIFNSNNSVDLNKNEEEYLKRKNSKYGNIKCGKFRKISFPSRFECDKNIVIINHDGSFHVVDILRNTIESSMDIFILPPKILKKYLLDFQKTSNTKKTYIMDETIDFLKFTKNVPLKFSDELYSFEYTDYGVGPCFWEIK